MTDIFVINVGKIEAIHLLMEPYNHTHKDFQSYINIQNKIIIFRE